VGAVALVAAAVLGDLVVLVVSVLVVHDRSFVPRAQYHTPLGYI
jgi:hypothetical protein